MTFAFEVLVTLKPGLSDPQGKAVEARAADARVDERLATCTSASTSGSTVEAADEAAARAQVDGDGDAAAVQPRDRGLPDPGDREEALRP